MKIKLIAKIKDVIIGYIFDTDTDITIGREIGNTIAPIIDSISRRHAHIFFADGNWMVEDLGSTNGSLINGKKIEGKVALKAGDSIRFGLIDMSVTFDQPVAEPVTASEPPPPPPPIPAPAPVATLEPVAALEPVAELEPLAPLEPLEPLAPLEPIAPLEPELDLQKTVVKMPSPGAVRKPAIGGGIKPGVKLPTKPSLPAGLKLPPKPGLKTGIKLPPRKG